MPFIVNYVWEFSDYDFVKYSFLLLILEKQAYFLRGGKKRCLDQKYGRENQSINKKNMYVRLTEKLVQDHQGRQVIFICITLLFVIS